MAGIARNRTRIHNTSNKAPPDTTGRADPFPDEVLPLNNTPARARWDDNSADTLRSLLYRTTSQQDHGDVRVIPPHVDLSAAADHAMAPSLPTSRKVHPLADVNTGNRTKHETGTRRDKAPPHG